MIRATLRTITGRRGSFYGGAAVVLAGVLIVIAVVIVIHVLRPGRNPSTGGQPLFDGGWAVVLLVGTVVAILIGALAGSYDAAQGTMRYLVMTGATRGRVYAARTIAVMLAVCLALLPSTALVAAGALALPHASSDAVALSDVGGFAWSIALFAGVFALISMGIGTLMRSNGAAIAISLVFAVGFTPLLVLIEHVSQTLADLMLPNLLDRLTGADTGAAIPVAALALLAWIGVFLAAGWLRVQRDEY